ncbi:MAG: preprotein translocase subunit SecA [bacterium]|nr:preprotein translocase subunit SecA [bacterium]
MVKSVLKMIFGDSIARALNQYRAKAEAITPLEAKMSQLSDDQLRAKTDEFKQRLSQGETLDDILPDAFAVVREAAKRTLKMRHYDVQLIGGMVLHEGKIAEMKTGEGKTLVATLPLYLNSLLGQGAHLVTPNDYLSKYGLQQMGAIYHFLGLTAAVIQNQGNDLGSGSYLYDPTYENDDDRFRYLRPISRREAYHADITYGTNNEFGFDYLRDNMVMDKTQLVQRPLHFAIVDEVDNILIDEARTPLIISGQADEPSSYYQKFSQLVKKLKPSSEESISDENPDGDYVIDLKDRVSYLTEQGIEKIEKWLAVGQLYHPDNAELVPYLDNCLRAQTLYHLDKEYVIQNGEIIIVDEFTGRLMYGRRFSEGLHQAIEAKEGLQIRRENLTLATITFQNFFRMYKKLAGMTGTAMTEREEFERIYNLEVMPIPTNLPVHREDFEDLVYATYKAKWDAVVTEIEERHKRLQPILVGTVAIETSEYLSKLLEKRKIPHEVLNAKQHEREATIIAQAGRLGAVTIATNMAGRGVDILLGGNPEGVARDKLRKEGIDLSTLSNEDWEKALEDAKRHCAEDKKKVLEQGGLFVLGTERHDARRIDNQLRGRAGRQGDPGSSRFYISLEDDLMKRFGGERIKNFMKWARIPEDEPLEHKLVTQSLGQAQVRVEGHNFDIRKRVLEYDDVVNKQREMIYGLRLEVLSGEGLRERFLKMLEGTIADMIDEFVGTATNPDDWDLEALYQQLFTVFPVPTTITPDTLATLDRDALEETIIAAALETYDHKIAELGEAMPQAERFVMLKAIDDHWQRHLTDLDILREGIGLMSIAQRDPLVEYKREAFVMFGSLRKQIDRQSLRMIFTAQLQQVQRQPIRRQMQAVRPGAEADKKPEPVRVSKKLGRNEPCWCGSGKKYKDCHMRTDKAVTKTP